jgi:archaeosine-15-forming tRNA-guanine transglycosylase
MPDEVKADPEMKSGDDVPVVDKKGRALTAARAFMMPEEMYRMRRNLIVPMAG